MKIIIKMCKKIISYTSWKKNYNFGTFKFCNAWTTTVKLNILCRYFDSTFEDHSEQMNSSPFFWTSEDKEL